MLRYSTFELHLIVIIPGLLNIQQTVLYDLFKRMLGSGPVYPALGNHDSYNQSVIVSAFRTHIIYLYLRAQDAPHAIGGALADQFNWYVHKKEFHIYFHN
jgi:hypothetical protein